MLAKSKPFIGIELAVDLTNEQYSVGGVFAVSAITFASLQNPSLCIHSLFESAVIKFDRIGAYQ